MAENYFLGIDPSITNTGMVLIDAQGKLVLAVNGCEAYLSQHYSYDIEKYVVQAEYLVSMLEQYHIQGIAYEDYAFGSVHRAFALAEYGGILKQYLYALYPKPILLVAPARNKKFATGNGSANKTMMIKQAQKECPELATDVTSDICDAWFLAKQAWYHYDYLTAVKAEKGNNYVRIRLTMSLEGKKHE